MAKPDQPPINFPYGLSALFDPGLIAVVGASEKKDSVGGAIVRNLLLAGFKGTICPVHPDQKTVFGLPAFQSMAHLPRRADLAIVCTPARTVPGIMRECGNCNVASAIIISAGFRESGDRGRDLEHEIQKVLLQYPGLRLLGPNCVGALVPGIGLNASFASNSARPGRVAFLSQSGALCTALLGTAWDQKIGFSHFVSLGNMLDIGFADLLDYFAEDSSISAVAIYMESVTDAPRFMQAAWKCSALKPVIVYKAGQTAAAIDAAASHTGALAGEDAVYDAVFRETGLIRVRSLDDLVATVTLLATDCWPRGSRLAIVSNAGGPGVIATDALIQAGGTLASLTASTLQSLDAFLPSHWSRKNPVDVIGDATADRLVRATEIVIADPKIDAVLSILTPQAMMNCDDAATCIARLRRRSSKPLLAAWLGGSGLDSARKILREAGIPVYLYPEQAVNACMHLASYAERQATPSPPQLDCSARLRPADLTAGSKCAVSSILSRCSELLDFSDAKAILSPYQIPAVRTIFASSVEDAVASANIIGYPVALKLVSPQISHKRDVGGVHLNLSDAAGVISAFESIQRSLARACPDAQMLGVVIQPMVQSTDGIEVIVGAKRDPILGSMVLIGLGGTAAEIMNDRSIVLAPVNEEKVQAAVASLRSHKLFEPYRGRPALNISALADLAIRMSLLLEDFSQIQVAETNPVLLDSTRAIALDARISLLSPPPSEIQSQTAEVSLDIPCPS